MPVYYYKLDQTIDDKTDLIIKVTHPDVGTVSTHIIDEPGNSNIIDFKFSNEGQVNLGKASNYKSKIIKIYSKAFNINKTIDDVALDYEVNGVDIVKHSNKKSEDMSPQLKIMLEIK